MRPPVPVALLLVCATLALPMSAASAGVSGRGQAVRPHVMRAQVARRITQIRGYFASLHREQQANSLPRHLSVGTRWLRTVTARLRDGSIRTDRSTHRVVGRTSRGWFVVEALVRSSVARPGRKTTRSTTILRSIVRGESSEAPLDEERPPDH